MKTLKEEYVASALNQYLNEPINMDFSKQGEKNSPLYCDRQTKPSSALRKWYKLRSTRFLSSTKDDMLSTSILQHVKLYEIFKTIFQQTVRPVVWLPQYAPAPCKWWLKQPPRLFSLEVAAHVGDATHHTPSVCIPRSMFVGFPIPKTWLIFDHGVNRPGDLDLWPSDL